MDVTVEIQRTFRLIPEPLAGQQCSGLFNGGILNSLTLGVNWFLNPNLKFQFNYDITYRSQVAQTDPAWINAGGVRMAFDF